MQPNIKRLYLNKGSKKKNVNCSIK